MRLYQRFRCGPSWDNMVRVRVVLRSVDNLLGRRLWLLLHILGRLL